jgi:hypothetical protein
VATEEKNSGQANTVESNRGIQALESRSDGRMCIVAGTLVGGSTAICLRLPMASKPKDIKDKNQVNLPILTWPVILLWFWDFAAVSAARI